MHSTVSIQPEGQTRGLSNDLTTELQDRFRDVLFNFIDEVSMVSAQFLQAYHARLCVAKEQSSIDDAIPFGGLHMVFFGDFAQFPPVKQTALWRVTPTSAQPPGRVPTVLPVDEHDSPPTSVPRPPLFASCLRLISSCFLN